MVAWAAMTRFTASVLFVVGQVCFVACQKDSSEVFERANKALEQTMARTGDVTYRHEDFDAVLLMLRAVPQDDPKHGLAMTIADEIQTAREAAKRDRASIQRAADRPVVVPKTRDRRKRRRAFKPTPEAAKPTTGGGKITGLPKAVKEQQARERREFKRAMEREAKRQKKLNPRR